MVESLQDVAKFEYVFGMERTTKWIKTYSDKIALHGSHTKNDTAILYSVFKRHIGY